MIGRVLAWVPLGLAVAACASGSSAPDGGDGGPSDSGPTFLPDSGGPQGCAEEGEACGGAVSCCTITCGTGQVLQVNFCDPTTSLCLPNLFDGGTPTCPGGGLPDASFSFDAGPPEGCGVWQAQLLQSAIVPARDVSAPAGTVPLAVGTGPGQGQLLMPDASVPAGSAGLFDAGFCPRGDAGAPWTWTPASGIAANLLSGVWSDPSGDVFAVGQGPDGHGLLLAGSLDGGLAPVALDGGPATTSLLAVLGLSASEALAVGFGPGPTPVALHFVDGGVFAEPVYSDAGVSEIYRVAGTPGGPVLALGQTPGNPLPSALELFARVNGAWVSEGAPPAAGDLWGLDVAPNGDVWIAADDGAGGGLAFSWSPDAGFVALDLSVFGTVPPINAIHETPDGQLFLAAVPGTGASARMLVGAAGGWSYEPLPAGTIQLNAIAGDSAATLFAAGSQACPDCDGGEVPLVLRRLSP